MPIFLLIFTLLFLEGAAAIPVLDRDSLCDKEKVLEASRAGIFYFEIPEECQELIPHAVEYAYMFPHDPKARSYSDGKFGGYHEREHDQIESFYVERADWNYALSPELYNLASSMNDLANTILESLLKTCGISEEHWEAGCGLLAEGLGQRHFSLNHYRPEKDAIGIKSHKDFGFISILFPEKEGLEVLHENCWVDVPPREGCFVVIIGKAFEILVDDPRILTGAWHRVRKLNEERTSFAITLDNDENYPVSRYRKDSGRLEIVHRNYPDYLKECFQETYR